MKYSSPGPTTRSAGMVTAKYPLPSALMGNGTYEGAPRRRTWSTAPAAASSSSTAMRIGAPASASGGSVKLTSRISARAVCARVRCASSSRSAPASSMRTGEKRPAGRTRAWSS